MYQSLKDTFPWRHKALDRRGRIDRLFATLNDADLEAQFRLGHWKNYRKTGKTALIAIAVGTLLLMAVDVLFNGWTGATIGSTLVRGMVVLSAIGCLSLGRVRSPSRPLDLSSVVLAVSIGGCLTFEYLSRGIHWDDLAIFALVAASIFTLFMCQPFKLTLFNLAAALLPFTLAMLVTGPGLSEVAAFVALYSGTAIAVYYMHHIAILNRDWFLQSNQLEAMAGELDENMQTMALEHRAVQRAAEENAALADDLALARIEAEQNAYYLENILENIAQGVVVLDDDLKITKFNTAYTELAGIPAHLAKVGTHISEIVRNALDRGFYVDEETRQSIIEALERPNGLKVTEPSILERAQGNGRYVEVRRNPLPGGGEVSTYTDITDRRRADELMRSQAMRDPLTDLSNRFHYGERLNDAIARSKRTGLYVALAYLDLDLFKPVNDAHGHAVGDAVLCEFASILRAHTREADTVARLGGDEFAIIFDSIKSVSEVTNPIERIMIATGEPSTICGVEIRIGISVGVAFCPLDAMTAEGLAEAADHALYEAKNDGRGCYRLSRQPREIDTRLSSAAVR